MAQISLIHGQKTVRNKAYWYERLGFWRRREVPIWRPPGEGLRDIIQWKPHVILGYVMTLKILAETVEMQQIQAFPPRIIFHMSAILDEASRLYFESVFQAEVIDVYGSFESGCIAWECKPCKGYHVCSDMVKVEILKEGQPVAPGERGEVVITNLNSYAMPFIRYRLGDMVTFSTRTPRCGCSFPLLERIDGRLEAGECMRVLLVSSLVRVSQEFIKEWKGSLLIFPHVRGPGSYEDDRIISREFFERAWKRP